MIFDKIYNSINQVPGRIEEGRIKLVRPRLVIGCSNIGYPRTPGGDDCRDGNGNRLNAYTLNRLWYPDSDASFINFCPAFFEKRRFDLLKQAIQYRARDWAPGETQKPDGTTKRDWEAVNALDPRRYRGSDGTFCPIMH
jgi:hypothetical protein